MNGLEQARETINSVDEQMARLFEQRMKAAEQVAAYKAEHDLPVYDPVREDALISRNLELVDEPYREAYEKFLRNLIAQSSDYQRMLISRDLVAYAGVEGAFAHAASRKLFPSNKLQARNGFEDVFRAVVSHQAQYGVIPFENTNAGLIGEVMDLLYQYPVGIELMSDQKIEQCLLGLPEATLKDIEWVYSKDAALDQSAPFLDQLGVERIAYPNTAMAAQYVADQKDKTKAAVAAKESAELYGLKVLASHIEANPSNTTRFMVITDRPSEKIRDHLGLLLSVKNEVGALAHCIDIISAHGLNMTSLQSRPQKDHPFEYFFFIQCSGDLSQQQIDSLFRALAPYTFQLKSLGSYDIQGESS